MTSIVNPPTSTLILTQILGVVEWGIWEQVGQAGGYSGMGHSALEMLTLSIITPVSCKAFKFTFVKRRPENVYRSNYEVLIFRQRNWRHNNLVSLKLKHDGENYWLQKLIEGINDYVTLN